MPNDANKVLLGKKECPMTNMKATGVPQHLAIMHELIKVVGELRAVNRSLAETKNHLAQRLLNLGEELPDRKNCTGE
jgi:cell division protein ZapA (FtsZ GTPase activity inhibitor)